MIRHTDSSQDQSHNSILRQSTLEDWSTGKALAPGAAPVMLLPPPPLDVSEVSSSVGVKRKPSIQDENKKPAVNNKKKARLSAGSEMAMDDFLQRMERKKNEVGDRTLR